MTTPSDVAHLQHRLRGITNPNAIMPIIAGEILERHHQASTREIAHLLLYAAGVVEVRA